MAICLLKSIIKVYCNNIKNMKISSIKQFLNEKQEIIIILALLLLILPFIFLSIYNNPSSDDFSDTAFVRKYGFLASQIKWYNEYTGRFISTGLLSIYPLLGNWFIWYKVFPIFIFVLLYLGFFYFTHSAFGKTLMPIKITLISLILFCFYVYQIPNICQAFYWVPASLAYQLPNAAMLFLFSWIVSKSTISYFRFFIICLFLIVIVGSNEIHMIFLVILIGSLNLRHLIKYKKINFKYFILGMVTLLCSLIVVLAPGNSHRAIIYNHNLEFINSLNTSFKYCNQSITKWLPLLILMFFVIAIFGKKLFVKFNNSKLIYIININPLLVLLATYVLTLTAFFPSLYFGGYLPARVFNLAHLVFFFGWIGFILSMIKYIIIYEKRVNFTSKYLKIIIISVVIFFLSYPNNYRNAYSDLMRGRAYKYNVEYKKRITSIELCSSDTCYVNKITNKPVTLFYADDLMPNQAACDGCMASYFNKKVIIVK